MSQNTPDQPADSASLTIENPNQLKVVMRVFGMQPYVFVEALDGPDGSIRIEVNAGGGVPNAAELVAWLRDLCDNIEASACG